jgi:uncharacterized protein (TIGR02217 family)
MQQNLAPAHANVVFEHDKIIPNTVGGPMFSTDITVNHGGVEQRNANYRHALGRWDIGAFGSCQSAKDYILSFFRQRRGRYQSFLWRDLSDFVATATPLAAEGSSVTTQGLIEITGAGTARLVKQYVDGAYIADRVIYCPVAGTINGLPAGWTLNLNDGTIVAPTAQAGDASIPVDFQFLTPVRFDVEHLPLNLASTEGHAGTGNFEAIWTLGSTPIVEVRL